MRLKMVKEASERFGTILKRLFFNFTLRTIGLYLVRMYRFRDKLTSLARAVYYFKILLAGEHRMVEE